MAGFVRAHYTRLRHGRTKSCPSERSLGVCCRIGQDADRVIVRQMKCRAPIRLRFDRGTLPLTGLGLGQARDICGPTVWAWDSRVGALRTPQNRRLSLWNEYIDLGCLHVGSQTGIHSRPRRSVCGACYRSPHVMCDFKLFKASDYFIQHVDSLVLLRGRSHSVYERTGSASAFPW